MGYLKTTTAAKILQTVVIVLAVKGLVYGQNLELKLSREASFVPQSTSVLEQLIEVAKYYQIPMGIEWVDQSDANVFTLPKDRQMTVQNLIAELLSHSQDYQAKVENGVLHIAQSTLATDTKNFLNLRISEFQVDKANLFGASFMLRMKIRMMLHPEQYAGGWNGGYGEPSIYGFDIKNITVSGRNLTVREILNKIITANGNALWVVRLDPSKMMADEPFFAQGPVNKDGQSATGFYWQFISLKGEEEREGEKKKKTKTERKRKKESLAEVPFSSGQKKNKSRGLVLIESGLTMG